MPVNFLSADQEQRYGKYKAEPDQPQLARYFHLDEADQELVASRRSEYNKLGFALQLCTVRFLGTFLVDPTAVPPGAVEFVAQQLGIREINILPYYLERKATHHEHASEIQRHFGYRDFFEQPEHFRLVQWLYLRAWLSAERPSVLFDLATNRLVERKILLPGVSTLARLVASVRDKVSQRLWRVLSHLPTAAQTVHLESLLKVPPENRLTLLDQLRRSPTRVSGQGMVGALERLNSIRAVGVSQLNLQRVPPSRVKALARFAMAARAASIDRMPPDRRIATLLAFVYSLEAIAQDDALDLLHLLTKDLLNRSDRKGQRERMRTLKDLDGAALQLREACAALVDPECEDAKVREATFGRISRDQLIAAIAVVTQLAKPYDDRAYYEGLLTNYITVRHFFPTLLSSITFKGNEAGQPVLAALAFLKGLEDAKGKVKMSPAPRAVVSRVWQRFVLQGHHHVTDRRYYTFCVLERLQDSLSRRDVFVEPSERWGDPRAKLVQGQAWETLRPQITTVLNRSLKAEDALTILSHELDEAYLRTAARLPNNADCRVEPGADGQDELVLSNLDKLEEPASLTLLKEQVTARLPRVDLTEVLLEVANWTHFAQEFTHISEANSRVEDLTLSVCAVLLSEACNIGLEPVLKRSVAALKRDRLSHIQQNYIRSDTLTQANVRLVNAQSEIKLAQAWGGGDVASADGLRFVVPVRTINAGPNSKYFGVGRGVTYYNFVSDQFTGFHAIVIPGTLRDSLYLLDGLLEQQTGLPLKEVMTDTAGYSDAVFGLFWLLGYQFSPRIADVGAARFWRLDASADYGLLNNIAEHRINRALITSNYDDLLRVAASLKTGTIKASELLRSLQLGNRPSTLARAISELGRIAKTLYLLAYIDDEAYRRRVLTQLNRGESRHTLARFIFHGQKGELRQCYREGQEDQLGALGLVTNMVILWNTRYMDKALGELRANGAIVKDEDVARLSPLGFSHINVLGRYDFKLADEIKDGQLRALRDPSKADD